MEVGDWIDVEDRLPEVHADVLVRYEDGFAVAYLTKYANRISWDTHSAHGHEWDPAFGTELDARWARITHWIPLPPPPAPKSE